MAELLGSPTPRLWTPPLRRLTRRTSRGFAVVEFAEKLGVQLLPWQRWVLVHGLELRKSGGYRFRTVVVLVSRQNGKTTILKVLALWRMVEGEAQMVLGTSTNMQYAREAWMGAVELAEAKIPEQVEKVKYGALDTSLTMANGARYKIGTASRTGGRSLSVDLGIADELREHRPVLGGDDGWAAWAALDGTTIARPDPQVWALSNAGDQQSVVLNHLRALALADIEAGGPVGDDSLALFEWSGPEGCEIDDWDALQTANPGLGHTITEAALRSKMKLPPAVFRTEHLCQNVAALNEAVDVRAWSATGDPTLDQVRHDWVACVDVAPDSEHVTLALGAALSDGRVRVEVAAAWEPKPGLPATEQARRQLPGLLAEIRPRKVAWFPSGPAKPLASVLRPPAGGSDDRYAEIKGGAVSEACMGFADLVEARLVVHPGDPLLTAHVTGAQRLPEGDGWRFVRSGAAHCDAAYAAAGAVHVALLHPPAATERPRLILPRPRSANSAV